MTEKVIDRKSIEAEVVELKKKLFSLNMKKSMGELDKPLEIRETKKAIARLMTKLNSK